MTQAARIHKLAAGPFASSRDKLSDHYWQSALLSRKIRSLRSLRGMTQKQLAQSIGVNEAAIRNYELQAAYPKQVHLDKMAEAFGVRPECLRLYDLGAEDSVTANALFQIADVYGFTPCSRDEYAYLSPQNDFMHTALMKWAERYEALRQGRITDGDYRLWKDCFSLDFNPTDFPERYEIGENGAYRLIDAWEIRHFSSKLKSLRAEKGMTQTEFADFLGIRPGVYRSYEHGRRLPKLSVVEKIASSLGVTKGSLKFFDFGSPVQAFHALFQLAYEDGLRPDVVDGSPMLRTQTSGLEQIIDQWRDALDHCETDSAFEHWKDHYDPDTTENRLAVNTRYQPEFDATNRFVGTFSVYDPYNSKYPEGFLRA